MKFIRGRNMQHIYNIIIYMLHIICKHMAEIWQDRSDYLPRMNTYIHIYICLYILGLGSSSPSPCMVSIHGGRFGTLSPIYTRRKPSMIFVPSRASPAGRQQGRHIIFSDRKYHVDRESFFFYNLNKTCT